MEQRDIKVVQHKLQTALNTAQVQKLAKDKDNPNDNPLDITAYFHDAYKELYLEIVREINPDFIIAPYGTGEAVFGLVLGALAQQRALSWAAPKNYPIITPKIIGVKLDQPDSLADKLNGDSEIFDVPLILRPRHAAEIVAAANHSPYPQFLVDHPRHFSTISVDENQIQEAYNSASPHLQTEPSAAIAFAAIPELTSDPDTKGKKFVIINSGRSNF